jgi:hypothetical protein
MSIRILQKEKRSVHLFTCNFGQEADQVLAVGDFDNLGQDVVHLGVLDGDTDEALARLACVDVERELSVQRGLHFDVVHPDQIGVEGVDDDGAAHHPVPVFEYVDLMGTLDYFVGKLVQRDTLWH